MRLVAAVLVALAAAACSSGTSDPVGAAIAPTPAKCASVADCPHSPCFNVSCTAGFCDTTDAPDGTMCSKAGAPGTCHAGSCAAGACATHADCAAAGDERCIGGTCKPALATGGDCSSDATLCVSGDYCGTASAAQWCKLDVCCEDAPIGKICSTGGPQQRPCAAGLICDVNGGVSLCAKAP